MTPSSHRPYRVGSGSGLLARAAMLAALAGLVHTTWRTCRDTHRRRLLGRPAAPPDRLQVWEAEGGQNQMPGLPADDAAR